MNLITCFRFLNLASALASISCTSSSSHILPQQDPRDSFTEDKSLDGEIKKLANPHVTVERRLFKPVIVFENRAKNLSASQFVTVDFAECSRVYGPFEDEEGFKALGTVWLQNGQAHYIRLKVTREDKTYFHAFATVNGTPTGETFADEKRAQTYWAKKVNLSRIEINEDSLKLRQGDFFVIFANRMLSLKIGNILFSADECHLKNLGYQKNEWAL